MTRRLLLSLPLLLVACLVVPLNGQAAKTRYKTGVSDQVASSFLSPLYTSLGLSTARYITAYDVMVTSPTSPDRLALDEWITNARKAGQDILISFEHSHTRGREKRIPNVREFAKDLKLFMRAYPFVRSISPWNEANRCQRTIGSGADRIVVGQPICHKPKQAAAYYNTTVKTCKQLKRKCRIVALDILDQNNVRPSVKYVKSFLKRAKPRPKIWGIHNYSDTNRFSTTRTKALIKATRKGEVWLTETGGIVKFGTGFPFNTKRAAKALGCMFTIAKSNRRIKRLYIYNFAAAQPEAEFDSGLVNTDGTKRPGWDVVKKRKAGRCKK
jgi:hypothetical protein